MRLVRFWSLRGWTLLTTSRCTLRRDGTSWVRIGANGPGVRVYDFKRSQMPFSIRFRHEGALRFGRFALQSMRAVGRWP